jgi:outer membrane protein OmpA-like peptidoglycan-associated protein
MKSQFIFVVLFLLNVITYSQDTSKLKPTAKDMLVNVIVTNFQNVPRANDIVIFKSIKSKKTYSGMTNAKGKYSLLLPKGDTYEIKYRDFTDTSKYDQFETPNKPGEITGELTIQIETPKHYYLDNVFFDTGLSTLKPSSYKALNSLYEVMKLKPALVIEIGGHTDNTGTKDINKKLSQDRANAVRNYLIKKGIAANRITAVGYGDSEPVSDNATEEGKAKNRRTEVTILKE